jgi:glycosyltransferase involved in cell wall biosynthesis
VLVSILIPVYNERTVVEASLRAVLNAPLPENLERELIVVDDRSGDGTWEILQRLAAAEPRIHLFRHEVNQGKGAAVRSAISKAQGDFCLIQDADLEYDPNEYPILLKPLLQGHADAVFGSRYLVREQTRILPFWHTMINKLLTITCNMFANINVTDMETCYKVFRTDLLKSIPIRSNRFGIEPEITMKAAKRRLRIYEVPISYHGRTYEEGKKIGWMDGLKAFGVILKFWLIDDLYAEPFGKGTLVNLTRTPSYLARVVKRVRPALGDRVVEIGAGTGTFSGLLMGRRTHYVAAENDPLYLHSLRNRFLRTPNVTVCELDPSRPGDYARAEGPFDTALCLNVLEGLQDPAIALAGLHSQLKPDGTLIVLAPQLPSLFGSADRAMGQLRRFSLGELVTLLRGNGFEIEAVEELNKIAVPFWWLTSRVMHRRQPTKITLKIFDKMVWLWRLCDALLPTPGLSLLLFARKKA